MASNEERVLILRMIEEGKISADEGTRLLAALGSEGENQPAPVANVQSTSRTLRVRVTDSVTGSQKVNVNIPTSLVTFGLQFVPDSADFDAQAVRQAIESGISGRIADIQDDEGGKRVEIFIE